MNLFLFFFFKKYSYSDISEGKRLPPHRVCIYFIYNFRKA